MSGDLILSYSGNKLDESTKDAFETNGDLSRSNRLSCHSMNMIGKSLKEELKDAMEHEGDREQIESGDTIPVFGHTNPADNQDERATEELLPKASSSDELNQILSAKCLQAEAERFATTTEISSENIDKPAQVLIEIDLTRQHQDNNNHHVQTPDVRETDKDQVNTFSSTRTNGQMFAPLSSSSYRYCEDPRATFRNVRSQGLSETQPKLSFASKRMKEYFESFKGHSGESARLYQFFKSIRTELVACLLFSLIVSQSLIVCRTNLDPRALAGTWPLERDQTSIRTGTSSSNHQTHAQTRAQTHDQNPSQILLTNYQHHEISSTNNGVASHLISGLVSAFTVASLTQVFGHISGCHLIPSISLALYFKGHISRARLASYLAAQSIGALTGVALLTLLTSSQVTTNEYRQTLGALARQDPQNKWDPYQMAPILGTAVHHSGAVGGTHSNNRRRRRRRQVDNPNKAEVNLNEVQGSEMILLSIMEQKQRLEDEKNQVKQSRLSNVVQIEQETISRDRRQDNASTSSGSTSDTSSSFPSGPGTSQLDGSSRSTGSPLERTTGPSTNDNSIRPLVGTTNGEPPRAPERQHATATRSYTDQLISDLPPVKADLSSNISTNQPANELPNNFPAQSTSSRPPKLKRKKRQRQQQRLNWLNNASDSSITNGANNNGHNLADNSPGDYYINLLEFALPDEIMASDSIRQCISKQNSNDERASQSPISSSSSPLGSWLSSASFNRCLKLSNTSQMFVYQLLATSLVVLTYLVNVDPRRIDLGFKSLSIGLAYFIASSLTIQSGGFYGNPMHLISLNWFSSTSRWHTEWFIYLITPLIGGLFAAISHEYIDFTSLRNRNKQLHLRRSFYSLDNLQSKTNDNQEQLAFSELRTTTAEVHHQRHQQPNNRLTLDQSQSTNRKLSSSSSSLSSSRSAGATSSVLTLQVNGDDQQQQFRQMPTAARRQQASGSLVSVGSSPSYSRQIKLEQQRLTRLMGQQQAHACDYHQQAPARLNYQRQRRRSSDFDSNFLISSPAPLVVARGSPAGTGGLAVHEQRSQFCASEFT